MYLLWINGSFYIGMTQTFYWCMIGHGSPIKNPISRLTKPRKLRPFQGGHSRNALAAALTHVSESILIAATRSTEARGLNSQIADNSFPMRDCKVSAHTIVELFKAAFTQIDQGRHLPSSSPSDHPVGKRLFGHLNISPRMMYKVLRGKERETVSHPLLAVRPIRRAPGLDPCSLRSVPSSWRRRLLDRCRDLSI